jgi:hypothetical protein
MIKSSLLSLFAAIGLAAATPAAAQQVQTIDPNKAGEYEPAVQGPPQAAAEQAAPSAATDQYQPIDNNVAAAATPVQQPEPPTASANAAERAGAASGGTVAKGDIFRAAEGVFGRGAEGLAQLIEDILRKQGQPSAYITGREAGGAFALGVRYGSGTLHHAVEGDRPVFWNGPSLGFDFGADANKIFVLVYNLHDSQEIFRRYPGAEGNAYVVGGFTASYMRRGDVVLIPVRLGVGARLGANAGYIRFSEKSRLLPF